MPRALLGGINFVSVAVGVFGVAEILRNLENEKDARRRWSSTVNEPLADQGGLQAHRRRRCCAARRSARCSASCRAAGTSCRPSPPIRSRSGSRKHPEEFGKGAIEGVAGPESANNAAAQTSFIPLLTLGIPAHPVMALMIGAFIIQGITPGPERHHRRAGAVLGHHRLDVDRQPDAGAAQPAADRALGEDAHHPLPRAVPGDHRCSPASACYSINQNIFDVYAIAFFGLRRLRADQARLRAGAAAARLRARAAARGASAPGDDHLARRSDDLRRRGRSRRRCSRWRRWR